MKNRATKNRGFTDSLNNAIGGIKYAFRRERNMKFHAIATLCVILFSLFMDISKTEIILLAFTISLVVITELINTAIEVSVNTVVKNYHPKAKIIKDVSAGAVLVASLNAILVGYLIFIDRFGNGVSSTVEKMKGYPFHIVLISLIVTSIVVIVIKLLYNRGTPFRGGMPSGHTALAFGITTAIALWFQNIAVVIMCLILSMLVAQSRVEGKIHSIFEVIAGAIVGILVTLLVYKIIDGL